jgi:hypothetical protein
MEKEFTIALKERVMEELILIHLVIGKRWICSLKCTMYQKLHEEIEN